MLLNPQINTLSCHVVAKNTEFDSPAISFVSDGMLWRAERWATLVRFCHLSVQFNANLAQSVLIDCGRAEVKRSRARAAGYNVRRAHDRQRLGTKVAFYCPSFISTFTFFIVLKKRVQNSS